ncbi:TetR/AcrR family transcriptional regulator [Paracoccus sp. 1_MG-2023]|uniref:TetR/AcrR family transcriptional regulator n=1 Tax=unclassified Paracoccus (in: a-proteobacteria) TaxID=2688777 RepID=UPI001C087B30|nr:MULTISPECIES: TetR/AcrR family transcriptional regulator [unclassified Paracoccus (in: a-proteobacteria)]MBU2957370.1 TetR/AcrR family transcriptional regulator [Paracoccus sp. C2R09]MDO6670132.1 TetR/AcrR family transcriptional regulator [Paracoccus sp. 1_MG-2023]
MDKPLSARDRLLHAAAALFYNDGIAATGIDTITRRAGVAKQSLYNNFASKSDLIAAYVEARHAEWLALHARRHAAAAGPKARILAVFDAYADHAEDAYERGFRGCGLLNAAAELTADDPARAAVRRHKEEVEAMLADALTDLIPDEDRRARMADHLSYLLEGSITRAGLDGSSRRVHEARAMAADMLGAIA